MDLETALTFTNGHFNQVVFAVQESMWVAKIMDHSSTCTHSYIATEVIQLPHSGNRPVSLT